MLLTALGQVSMIMIQLQYIYAQGLVLPEERTIGQGCITAGKNISYQCTVTDPTEPPIGLTIWSGSAFKCSGTSNKILLQHFRFLELMPTSCGSLSAMALEVDGNSYLSQLSFTAFTELNGKNISCSLSDDMTVIGSDTLIVGVPPPPPEHLNVTSAGSLITVSWSPPSDPVEGGVGGYVFGVIGKGCGCVSMNISGATTSVTCSGWTAAGQTCSFEVRTLSQDCGFSSDPVKGSQLFQATCDPAELGNNSVSTSLNTPGTATTLNGVITYNGIVVGSTSDVTCNDGYIPKDPSSNRTCMINGNWSGSAQICVPLQVKSSSQENLGFIALVALVLIFLLPLLCLVVICMRKGSKVKQDQPVDSPDGGCLTLEPVTTNHDSEHQQPNGSANQESNVAARDQFQCMNIWKGKEVLNVCFMNPEYLSEWQCRGEPMNINTILAWARVWNLVPCPQIPLFEVTTDKEEADIRVKFSGGNGRNWSMVGNTSTGIPDPQDSTMKLNLSGHSPPFQESLVIQQFGRALGLENEHQHPDFWDAVENHLDINQMEEDVGHCFFTNWLYKMSSDSWKQSVNYLTDYDPKSIMHCQFKKSWIKAVPDSDPVLTNEQSKYLESLQKRGKEGQLPKRPSENDYKRLVAAYGGSPITAKLAPSTEIYQKAFQTAKRWYNKLQIWKGKQMLKVYFINPDYIDECGWKCRGEPINVNTILAWARVWNILPYPEIPRFELVEDDKKVRPDIRVQFSNSGDSWSKVGVQAINTDPSQPTMQLNLADDKPELQESIVIKQFGHALGLENEHQRSDFWDVLEEHLDVENMKTDPKVASSFEDQWGRASEVETINSLSEYDPGSITHFRFDLNWIKIEFHSSGKIDRHRYPHLKEQEIKFLQGLHSRSKSGQLPKRPSVSDYERLAAAYGVCKDEVHCTKIWKKSTLNVYFMNPEAIDKWQCRGEPMNINTILAWARVWNLVPYPQIPFIEVTTDKEKADIRVEFSDDRRNWSMVGNTSTGIPDPQESTMKLNLSGHSPPFQESLVIQQFGRALGLENEHQRPDFWDAVVSHLDINQMEEDMGHCFFTNWLYKMSSDSWKQSVNYLTDYDPKSIMHCQFKKSWIKAVPDSDPVLTNEQSKYLESLQKRSKEGQLPKRPSENDYKRLIAAYGGGPIMTKLVPSTETFKKAFQSAKRWQIWKGKQMLKVYFINPDYIDECGWKCRGEPINVNTILAWARVWNILPYPTIPRFELVEDDKKVRPDIRVQFSNSGDSWSKVGVQAINTDPSEPTMQLNLADDKPELQESIVIKQFGHALGLENEHQRSDFWDVLEEHLDVESMKTDPKVASSFKDQWGRASEVETINSLSEYDPGSITHFRFDLKWIKIEFQSSGKIDRHRYPHLKEQEIKFLQGLYRRSKLGQLSKRPSVSDYERLAAAYECMLAQESSEADPTIS